MGIEISIVMEVLYALAHKMPKALSDNCLSFTQNRRCNTKSHLPSSEGELQTEAIPEEDETMPGNLHEAAAKTVASVAPSAIFAKSAKATEGHRRPPTPHYVSENLDKLARSCSGGGFNQLMVLFPPTKKR